MAYSLTKYLQSIRKNLNNIELRYSYYLLGMEQFKELNRLQKEDRRLCRAVSDLTLDKLILKEAASGNF
mgnify:FL=1